MAMRHMSSLAVYQTKYVAPNNALTAALGGWLEYLMQNTPGIQYAIGLLEVIFYYGLLWPLEYVYFHGPTLHGWGFWGGRHPHDICTEMTGSTVRFIESSAEDTIRCHAMLATRFEAFIGMICVTVYVFMVVAMFRWIIQCPCGTYRALRRMATFGGNYGSSGCRYNTSKRGHIALQSQMHTRLVTTPTPTFSDTSPGYGYR